jgi:hypothetical protein
MRNLALRFRPTMLGGIPAASICYIYVESFQSFEAGPDAAKSITPLCVNLEELREQVDRLKAELDEIVTEARSEFGAR